MRHYIGINLDESYMRAGIVDETGNLVCKESIRTGADRKANEIVRDLAYLAQNVIKVSRISLDEVDAIGIGFPGIANNITGTAIHSKSLPLHNINIRNDIRRIIPLPVYIENNVNCKAFAESLFGAAKGLNHSITMTIGEDIEGGVIINRRIYGGINHTSADVGHFIIEKDGEPCSCGRNGCFSAYASETAFLREIVKTAKKRPGSLLNGRIGQTGRKVDIRTLFDAVRDGDEAAKSVADRYIHELSLGLVNIISLLMPEAIVLDGEICKEGEFLLTLIREEIEKIKPYPAGIKKTKVVIAETCEGNGIIGPAMMAMLSRMDGVKGD